MEFRVLGPVEVAADGKRLGLGGPKQRTVVALLLAGGGRPVPTGTLIEGVYGQETPERARRTIQTYISNLRSELGDVISFEGDAYTLTFDRASFDALRFEDAIRQSGDDPERAGTLLRTALALWRGHPYADIEAHGHLQPEITRLNELRTEGIESRVDADLAVGRHRELVSELESLTTEYPLRERFRAQQMLALYRCGRQADALRAYERTRTYLVEELGIDPSPELRQLEQQILQQDASIGFEARPAIRRQGILVAEVPDAGALRRMTPDEREVVLRIQSDIIDEAVAVAGGEVFAHRGSAIYSLFDDASAAALAAAEARRALSESAAELQVSMAVDVGDIEHRSDGDVIGPPVNRAAVLSGAAHSGQIVVTGAAHDELTFGGGAGWTFRGLGSHTLIGLEEPLAVHQLAGDGRPTDFPPLKTDALPPPPPFSAAGLPGYEVRDEVGSGAFGAVHRAYQPSVGREVAVKVIRPEFANHADFIRRFEVEAQMVARLEHPHIVPLYDYWRSPEGAFLVMRWLRSGSLADRLASGPLSIAEATGLLSEIGPALDYAHRRGVAHRDLKPANILFDDDRHAYLSDFGIAQTVDSDEDAIARDVAALVSMLEVAVESLPDTVLTASFADVASLLEAWESAVSGSDAGLDKVRFTPTRNPYKGLHAFGEPDAGDFFGRGDDVAALVDAVAAHRLVVVVGPSGIGKSSVVRAGLVPPLRDGAVNGSSEWLITDMIPGSYPFEELASALIRVATDIPGSLEDELRRDERGLVRAVRRYLPANTTVMIVVDQFEELFTLTSSKDEQAAFLGLLAATISDERSNVRVVLTMRADYFDRPLLFSRLGDALRGATVPVSAPGTDDLRAIVVEPAAALGVDFEAGLVDRIVADVQDQPGALPLLEYSLTELFEERDTDLLQLKGYEAAGGVLGALGRRAEAIYGGFDEDGREAVRQVFLRLVNVSDTGRDTRRRVRRSELRRLGIDEAAVLETFGVHRLLTFDRDSVTRGPTVEVAHEALLTQWQRLADWIEEQREDLLLHGRLAASGADWEASDRAEAFLLAGGRLAQHEAWTAETDLTLTSPEQEFLAASRTAEDEGLAKRQRTRRRVLSGFGVAAAIGLLLAVAAQVARNDAQEQAALANENAAEASSQAALAEASGLATASINVLDDDPELSLLLALASADGGTPPGFEQRRALHAAIDRDKSAGVVEHRYLTAWTSRAWLSPDGALLAVSGEHRAPLSMYRATDEGNEFLWTAEEIPPELLVRAAFIKEGDHLLVWAVWPGGYDQSVGELDDWSVQGLYVFDAVTGDLVTRHKAPPFCEAGAVYSFDAGWSPRSGRRHRSTATGDLIAGWCFPPIEHLIGEGQVAYENTWWLQDAETGEIVFSETDERGVWWVNTTVDGSLVQIDHVGGTEIRDMQTGAVYPVPFDDIHSTPPMISPSGGYLLHGSDLLDPKTGSVVATMEGGLSGLEGCLNSPVFSRDDSRLMFGCEDATVRVFDSASGDQIARLQGHSGWVVPGSFASLPNRLATGSADGTARVWELGGAGEVRQIDLGLGYNADAGIDVVDGLGVALVYPSETTTLFDGLRSFLTRHAVGELVVIDLNTGQEAHRIGGVGGKVARFSPDGTRAVVQTASADGLGDLRVVDTATGQALFDLPGLCRWIPGTPTEHCADLIPAEAIDLAWSADGRLVAMAAGRSRQALVWDVTTQARIFVSEPAGIEPFAATAFSPDGSLLAASSKTGMWIYSTKTWKLIRPVIPHTGRPSWVMRFSSDGSELITAQAHSGDVRIYDTTEWTERNMRGGDAQTRDMAMSDDETMLALADREGNVHVLALATGELLELISLDDRDITNVEFIDDDRHLLITGATGPVEIITLDAEELLQIARSRISRSFTADECQQFAIDPCATLEKLRAG